MPQAGWSNAIDLSYPPYLDTRERRKQRLAAAVDAIPIKQAVDRRGQLRFWIGYEVWKVAVEYNGYRVMSRGAPRKVGLVKELERVARSCRQAANAIDTLSDAALELWHQGSIGTCGIGLRDTKQAHLYDLARGVGFPQWAGFPYPDLDDPEDQTGAAYGVEGRRIFLAPRLRLTAELADLLATKIGPDRGGGRDFFHEEHGSPTWHLARLSWGVFNSYGGEPTATENGPFHQFVEALHEFATGERSQTLPGLRDRVRAAIAICGERWRILNKRLDYISGRGGPPTQVEDEQYEKLERALKNGRLK